MKKGIAILIALVILAPSWSVGAEQGQDPAIVEESERSTTAKIATRYGMLLAFPAVVLAYGMETWEWGSRGSWRWGSEGFFGRDTDQGGADKMGHLFSCYVITRAAWHAFEYSEGDRWTKYLFAPLVAFTIGLGIEIGDAYTGKYGFSYEDLVMDSLGILLGMALEVFPSAAAFVGYSVSYWPTARFMDYQDRTVLDIESDASGYRYLFNFKLNGFRELGYDVPAAFRYLQLDFGYYTRGFSIYDKAVGDISRKRHVFMGISLNTAEVIRSFFKESNSVWKKVTATPFEYIHLPIGITGDIALD